jgi:nitrogen regulatory protein P-II 1
MKRIDATIKPHCLDEVKERLSDVGIDAMTISEVKGFGRTAGHREVYRGSAYVVEFVSKVRLEILVEDARVQDVVAAIAQGARTGKIGDGKIVISTVDEAIGIGADQLDEAAV